LFGVARTEAGTKFLHRPEERPSDEVVDLHGCSRQHLECHLMRWDEPLQRLLPSEQKQRTSTYDVPLVVLGYSHSKSAGDLKIRQRDKRSVTSASAFTDQPSQSFELKRVEIVPHCARYLNGRVIEDPSSHLLRRHLVRMEWDAARLAVPSDRPSDELAIGSSHYASFVGYRDDDYIVPL